MHANLSKNTIGTLQKGNMEIEIHTGWSLLLPVKVGKWKNDGIPTVLIINNN